MAKQKNNNAAGPSFADAIEGTLPSAQDLSSIYAQQTGGGARPPGVRTVPETDPANPYGLAFDFYAFDYHHDVFTIHRVWSQCRRCQDDFARTEPARRAEDEDPVCPHTRRRAYLAQMQKFLTEGHIRQSLREETLMDGSIQVSLAWLVPRVDKKRLDEAKKKSQVRTSEDPT